MASSNCTLLLITANNLPQKWADFHRQKLLEAAQGKPIIAMSRKPLNWPSQCLLDTQPQSISNIYYQMLQGAKTASTHYVAVVEDDTIYPPEHFDYQPSDDVFAYNINRFNVFTWGRSMYHYKNRVSNSTLVCNRELMVKALEERFSKYPDGTPTGITGELGRDNIANKLGLPHYPLTTFETYFSVVRVDHQWGVDTLSRSRRKGPGMLKAYDLPLWGRAKDLVAMFK